MFCVNSPQGIETREKAGKCKVANPCLLQTHHVFCGGPGSHLISVGPGSVYPILTHDGDVEGVGVLILLPRGGVRQQVCHGVYDLILHTPTHVVHQLQ